MSTSIPFCWQAMLDSKHHLYDKKLRNAFQWGMILVFLFDDFLIPRGQLTQTDYHHQQQEVAKVVDNPLLHPGIFDRGRRAMIFESANLWWVGFFFPKEWPRCFTFWFKPNHFEFLQRVFQIQKPLESHSKVSKTQHPMRIGVFNPKAIDVNEKPELVSLAR